jgi:hypothetical protein
MGELVLIYFVISFKYAVLRCLIESGLWRDIEKGRAGVSLLKLSFHSMGSSSGFTYFFYLQCSSLDLGKKD